MAVCMQCDTLLTKKNYEVGGSGWTLMCKRCQKACFKAQKKIEKLQKKTDKKKEKEN